MSARFDDLPKMVLILGGGSAGMAAANALANRGIRSIVVEKKEAVGGLAAELACKGSVKCVRCDVCLATDKINEASRTPLVRILTDSEITGLERQDGSFHAEITNHQGSRASLDVDAIIMCTGMEPFDSARAPRYGHGVVPNVISALELERELNRTGRIAAPNVRKIGFIQCVGSRGEKGGVDYCSTVCCKYALKLAKHLNEKLPEASISFFFMDWRACDGAQKDLESWASECEKASLVRSRPAEIFESLSSKPTVRYATQAEDIVEEEFDLIILSVGIAPSSGTLKVARQLEVQMDENGFVKTLPSSTKSSAPGIFVAGCASGPCDVEKAVASGIAAASEALAFVNISDRSKRVLVLGDLDEETASQARKKGLDIHHILWDDQEKRVLRIYGGPGDFTIWLSDQDRSLAVECGAVVFSLKNRNCSIESSLVSLEHLEGLAKENDFLSDVAILLQNRGECSARAQHHERALRCALQLKNRYPRREVTIISPEFIAFGSNEGLYKECQAKGVLFVRQREPPTLADEGLEVFDSISQYKVRPSSDVVAVAGDYLPIDIRDSISTLGVLLDEDGRSQNQMVKWKPSGCLRKGIFICGSPWGTAEERKLNLRAALEEAAALLSNPKQELLRAEADDEKCSACLTCIRSCPFEAPFINQDGLAEIDARLCQGCGICIDLCPSRAILLISSNDSSEDKGGRSS